LRKKSCKFC